MKKVLMVLATVMIAQTTFAQADDGRLCRNISVVLRAEYDRLAAQRAQEPNVESELRELGNIAENLFNRRERQAFQEYANGRYPYRTADAIIRQRIRNHLTEHPYKNNEDQRFYATLPGHFNTTVDLLKDPDTVTLVACKQGTQLGCMVLTFGRAGKSLAEAEAIYQAEVRSELGRLREIHVNRSLPPFAKFRDSKLPAYCTAETAWREESDFRGTRELHQEVRHHHLREIPGLRVDSVR